MKKRIKILCIVGARPNLIKIAPLFEEFKKYRIIKPILVHTGQHYNFEMSQVFFQDLKIPKPDYNLRVGSGSHAWQTAEIMERLELVLLKEKPDLVIVVGDVNSTLAGALTAAKLHIPVAHIEAGPRTFDKTMPEEINRLLTDHISDFLFCPTKSSLENLKKEGIKKGLYNVGDVMYDVFLKGIKIAQKKSKILEKLGLKNKDYLLLTIHRPANADNPERLKDILEAVIESGEKIVFPIHPRTKNQLDKIFNYIKSFKNFNNVIFIDPVGYLDMLILEKYAKKIITDSGGLQKEAYWSKVPCITLMNVVCWPEITKDGWNILVGDSKKEIIKDIKNFNPKKSQKKYFGNGKASERIVKIIMQTL